MYQSNLSEEEQIKLMTYAKPHWFPKQEVRYFDGHGGSNEKKQPSLYRYTENMLISCDTDNSVVIFKMRDYPIIPDDFISITAISYNPKGKFDKNWQPNPHPDNIYPTRQAVPDPIPLPTLESTRTYILTRMFTLPQLQNRSINRLIQCDLCIQPSDNSAQVHINNQNVSEWKMLKAAMDKSQIVFLGWGSGPYSTAQALMDDLRVCDKFDVDAFYDYLKARIQKHEVYSYALNQANQPFQPAAHVSKIVQEVTIDRLNAIFDRKDA